MSDGHFLIWSIEHEAWWAPNECGYVRELDKAGVYDGQRARQIVERANTRTFNECLIPLACTMVGETSALGTNES